MHLLDLYKKIISLDEMMAPPSEPMYPSFENTSLESMECEGMECEGCENYAECGGDMQPQVSTSSPLHNQQPDTVSMNLSINGSGSGGIRDLLDILKNAGISSPQNKAVMIGSEVDESNIDDELWANSDENAEINDIQSVIPTGNDLASNLGDSRPRKMDIPRARMNEQLIAKLSNHYSSIKNR